MTVGADDVADLHVLQTAIAQVGDGGELGVGGDHISDRAVLQIAVHADRLLDVIVNDVRDGDVLQAAGEVVAVNGVLLAKEDASAHHALGRGVDHAVNDDVADLTVAGKQAHQIAKRGVSIQQCL